MRRITALVLFSSIACTSAGEGIAPPLEAIYFPTGLVLSNDSRFLYVVNSDFDLQYNAGTLQSLDMEHIRTLTPHGCTGDGDCSLSQYCDLPSDPSDPSDHSFWCVDRSGANAGQPCGGLVEKSSAERITEPGRCEPVQLMQPPDGGASLFTDAVQIGAFATNAIVRQGPESSGVSERLFIPVRGDSSLNWADVSNGKFDCGQGTSETCNDAHRIGRDPSSNSRALVLPPEPYAIDATADTSAIVLTHQTQGAVSLLHNDWQTGPNLDFVYTGLPSMPIAVRAVPQPAVVTTGLYAMSPGFLVAYETTARMDLFRYLSDAQSTPQRPYLELTASSTVAINSGGYDVRDLAIDDSERRNCEQSATATSENCSSSCSAFSGAEQATCLSTCNAQNGTTLLKCANVPLKVYASSRSPASLLIGQTSANAALTPNNDLPYFNDAIPLPTGPSRIQIAHIINTNNEIETRILIVSFDSRRIGVFDPARKNIETWITTGRGPQAIVEDFRAPSADDQGHALVVVGHFTDSYLGVIELDRRRGRSYGTIVLSLGAPTPPRTSK
jgi:hypothetical protein